MINVLRRTYIFSELTIEELSMIAKQISVKKFKSDSTICYDGEIGECFFIITKGSVKVSKFFENGKELILAILHPGDSFGEMSLFEEIPRSAHCFSVENTETAVLTKNALLKCIKSNPTIAIKLLSVLSCKLRAANGHLESVMFSSLKERLERLIISYYAKTNQLPFILPYSQTKIAEILGTSRESVSRCLAELRKNGCLSSQGRKIIIRNIDTLQK